MTVIITFGAILGKTSNLQLVVIAFFEVIYYIVNRNICTKYLQAVDYGGGMYIHLFGSCFGLMVARVLFHKRAVAHENETSRYTSDLFAATGELFIIYLFLLLIILCLLYTIVSLLLQTVVCHVSDLILL